MTSYDKNKQRFPFLAPRVFHYALVLAFLGCYPLARFMPAAWAWENGIVENVQVAVLLLGGLMAGLAWRRLRPGPIAVLACCALPVWLLLAGRELSWGAVFLLPQGFGPDGPIYTSRILWYRPFVPAFAAVVLGCVMFAAWRHRLGRLIKGLIVQRRFPWGPFAILAGVACVSTLAEGHLHLFSGFSSTHAESYEELVELVGYLALLAAQARVFREMATRVAPMSSSGRAAVRMPETKTVDESTENVTR